LKEAVLVKIPQAESTDVIVLHITISKTNNL